MAHQHAAMVGSMGANAAIAAQRLGACVRMHTRVGDDAAGQAVLARLAAEGVDTRGVLQVAGKTTSNSAVVIDAAGERWSVSHRGSAIADNPPALNTEHLQGSQAILVDPRWEAGAAHALAWGKANGVRTVLDADVSPQAVLKRLVADCDWAAFSFGGLKAWAGEPQLGVDDASLRHALQLALASGAAQALTTLGVHGAAWLEGDHLHRIASPQVPVLDSTGAGDVFHAAFAVALAEGLPTARAIALANACAAHKCQHGAGVEGAPRRAELAEPAG